MPGFYGQHRVADAEASRRNWMQQRPTGKPAPAFKRSFRLILLLVFLFVIGSLLVRQSYRSAPSGEAQRTALARANLNTLVVALEKFHSDTGEYPSSGSGLVSLVHNPGTPGWDGPYIYELKPDPWSRIFVYARNPHGYHLASAGADGIPGTPDDILPTPRYRPSLQQSDLPIPVNTR